VRETVAWEATGLNTRHRPGPADTPARLTRPEIVPVAIYSRMSGSSCRCHRASWLGSTSPPSGIISIGSGNPNLEAVKYIKPELLKNPAIFPDEGVAAKLEQLKDLTSAQRRLRGKMWTEIKASR
jgi:hypothetical protein